MLNYARRKLKKFEDNYSNPLEKLKNSEERISKKEYRNPLKKELKEKDGYRGIS